MTRSKVYFGQIPREHWSYPKWVDLDKAAKERKKMEDEKVIYGGSESYRMMCRFNSGFFYRHELMQQFNYYWRVEPGVEYYCDIDRDLCVLLFPLVGLTLTRLRGSFLFVRSCRLISSSRLLELISHGGHCRTDGGEQEGLRLHHRHLRIPTDDRDPLGDGPRVRQAPPGLCLAPEQLGLPRRRPRQGHGRRVQPVSLLVECASART